MRFLCAHPSVKISLPMNFLSLVSVRGTHLEEHFTWNKGELGEPEYNLRIACNAATGQILDDPKEGILIILILLRY